MSNSQSFSGTPSTAKPQELRKDLFNMSPTRDGAKEDDDDLEVGATGVWDPEVLGEGRYCDRE